MKQYYNQLIAELTRCMKLLKINIKLLSIFYFVRDFKCVHTDIGVLQSHLPLIVSQKKYIVTRAILVYSLEELCLCAKLSKMRGKCYNLNHF